MEDIFSFWDSRKQFWDGFEKKYAARQDMQQGCENHGYGILEFHKYWPRHKQYHCAKDNCCKQKTKQKNGGDEVMYDSSSVQPNLDCLCNSERDKCDAKIHSNRQHSEEKGEECERKCNSPIAYKSLEIREQSDIQISKTSVKCYKQVNKIPVKHYKAEVQCTQMCTAKVHNSTAVKIQRKSERRKSTLQDKNQQQIHTDVTESGSELSSGNIRPTSTAIETPIAAQSESEKATAKIQRKSERRRSTVPDRNQHQIQTDVTESDSELSSGNIRPTSTAIETPIAAQSESEKATAKIQRKSERRRSTVPDRNQHQIQTDVTESDSELSSGNIRPTSTAIETPIAAQSESEKVTVKIQHKSERRRSTVPDKNQHQIQTDVTESDSELSSVNIRPTSTAIEAPNVACSESEKVTVKIQPKSERRRSTVPDRNQHQIQTDVTESDSELSSVNIRPTSTAIEAPNVAQSESEKVTVKIQHKSERRSTLPDKNQQQIHTNVTEGNSELPSVIIRPTSTAIEAPIAAQSESEKVVAKLQHKSERRQSTVPDKNQQQIHTDITDSDSELSSGNIRPTSTAMEVPIAAQSESEKVTAKIQHKSEITSALPDKNQHHMHIDVKEGDLKFPSGNINPTFSGTVKTNEQASDINCSNIKHSRENISGIAGHIMEHATIFGVAETAEVRQRYTRRQSILGKEGSVFAKNRNCKDGCAHSVCKNISLDEVLSKPFTEPITEKNNPDTARESCNSSDISDDKENVIKEKRPNQSTIHRSKNTDSSTLTCTSTTPKFSKTVVPDKTEIVEKQTKSEYNKLPQANMIANVSTLSTGILNDAVQTRESNAKGVICASAAKSVSSDMKFIHQKSSKLSSVENDNDLHIKNKNYVIKGKSPNKSVIHRPKNIDASGYIVCTSPTRNLSENTVADMIQILERQRNRESNEIPQTNRIAIASTISTAMLDDAVQTEERSTNAVIGASVSKSASNNMMHIHQMSSTESSLLENVNDLYRIHKNKCFSNLLQRNEKESNATNIIDKAITKHKAFMVLLHGNTAAPSTSCSKNNHKISEKENNPFHDKFMRKSSADNTEKVLLQDKMVQSIETIEENSLPVIATEKSCGNKCLAKHKIEEEYTSYSTVDLTANAIEDVLEKLRTRSKNSFRKRSSRLLKQVLSCETEEQVLTCSLPKLRNLTATEGQDYFTNSNETLDEINNGEIWTSLNTQNTIKLVTAEATRNNNQRQKQLQRRLENTEKTEANDESNTKDTNGIGVCLTVLGSNTYNDSDHSIEGKQKGECCISERLSTQNKTLVELTSQSCPFNHDENYLQSESVHSIKPVSEKQNMVAKMLEFDSKDKHLIEANREIKFATSDEIMEQLYENVSEKNTKCSKNSSPGKQVEENHSTNFDQQNNECIIQEPFTDSSLKMNNSVIKYKSKKLYICRSKAEFCESNSSKHNSNKLGAAESTLTQSKYQHMDMQRQEEEKRRESDAGIGLVVSKSNIHCEGNLFEIQSLHTKSSTYKRMNGKNKSLEKPPSNTFFQVPCPPKSTKNCTRNTNETHNVAPITLETGDENLTNGSFINSGNREQLLHELYEQDILRKKSVGKQIRKNLSSKTDKRNKSNINEEFMKPFASQINNFLVSEQHIFTTKKLEHADILKEINRYKISDNDSSGSLWAQDRSRNMHEETQVQVKIKRRKLSNITPARNAKVSPKVDLAILESSVYSNDDCNEIWQLQNKYSASGQPHTQSRTSNKPLSQLWPSTSVASVQCQRNLSSSDCVASKMLRNCNSESWTTFTSRTVNDLQTPIPKINKLRLLSRK